MPCLQQMTLTMAERVALAALRVPSTYLWSQRDVLTRWWGAAMAVAKTAGRKTTIAMTCVCDEISGPGEVLLWRGSHSRVSAQNLVDRYTPHVIPRVTVDQIST